VDNAASKSTSCLICPAGYICSCSYPVTATVCVAKFDKCPAGEHCPEGTWKSQAGVITGKVDCNPLGTEGFYCPEATPTKIPCNAGHYCDLNKMTALDSGKKCTKGYVCISNSAVAAPTDGVKGKKCPKGHYCPEGAEVEIPCPLGYDGATEGLSE